MDEITFVVNDKYNCFLCSFFGGILITSNDPDLKKCSATNYRRLYRLLSKDEKIELHAAIEKVKRDPERYFGGLINDTDDE